MEKVIAKDNIPERERSPGRRRKRWSHSYSDIESLIA